jgi:hypothetical protein
VFKEIIVPREEIILLRERESIFFYHFTPTLSGESVCGQLLIRSIFVLLFSFEVPLKKNLLKKSYSKKAKRNEKSNNKEGALCVFSFPLCDGAL